jgi:hypothetical protein
MKEVQGSSTVEPMDTISVFGAKNDLSSFGEVARGGSGGGL